MEGKLRSRLKRRRFLLGCTLTGGGIVAADLLSKSGQAQVAAPAIVTSDKMRPQIPFGVASGDITGNSAVVWSRCNRPGRMIVEYSTTESFRNVQRVVGPAALENSDFTARIYLAWLWVSRYFTESPSKICLRSTSTAPPHKAVSALQKLYIARSLFSLPDCS